MEKDSKMKEDINLDLFCFQCSLQFNKKTWFDLHISVVHEHENETEDIRFEGVYESQDPLIVDFKETETTTIEGMDTIKKDHYSNHQNQLITFTKHNDENEPKFNNLIQMI